MFILKQLIKLIRLLHADEGSFSLALGLSLSLFPGFAGFASILGALTLLIVLLFRVQMGAYFLGYFFFSLLSLPLTKLCNQIGYSLLTNTSLEPTWTVLYQWPVMHWLKFNHTLILGGQVVALVISIPAFFVFYALIEKYKQTVVQKLKGTKLYKNFVRTTFFINYNNILRSFS